MKTKSATPYDEGDAKLATAISRIVQIEQIHLIEFSAIRQAEIELAAVTIKHTAPEVTTQFNDQKTNIVVKAKFGIEGSDGNASESRTLLQIQACFLASYVIESADSDAVTPKQIEAFGKINGVYNIWPYWRELVQSATTRMALPPLTLQVLRIARKSRREGKKK